MSSQTDRVSPVEEPPEPRVGDMLGAYRLDAVAGEGGMGRVFCATHTRLDKRVAVKILRRRYARREESIARFFQEARAVNLIRHPNIVEITDFVEGAPGADSYYIMEWLDGETLAARLARLRVLPVSQAIHIGRQVASALAAVHRSGLVHRDLKPDNVFLVDRAAAGPPPPTPPGAPPAAPNDVKLLDFGVARIQGPTDGTMAGTPAYFSPEGAAGRALDGRSDIYSLGVMLYELVSGQTPFQGASMSEYVMKHMTAPLRPLVEVAPRVAPRVATLIERCLAKSPDDRFQSMDEVEAALAVADDELGLTRPVVLPRRMPWSAILAGGAAVLVGSFAATRVLRPTPAPPQVAPREPDPAPASPVAASAAPPAPRLLQPGPAPEAIGSPRAPSPAGATPGPAGDPASTARIEMMARSEPPGAEVYGEGVLLGVTPCVLHLPRGRQTLLFKVPGLRPRLVPVEPVAGGAVAVRLGLPPSAARGRPGGTINPFE